MKLMFAAVLALASAAPAGAEEPAESYLLIVKMGRGPAQVGRALRVTTVPTKAECKRLGEAIIATARDPRASSYYCHKGTWSPGPYTSGYAAGGYLLKNIEQRP